MKKWLTVLALCLAALGIYLCLPRRPLVPPPPTTQPAQQPLAPSPRQEPNHPASPSTPNSTPQTAASALNPSPASNPDPNSAPLQFTNIPPTAALDHLRNVFHQYASMFGGNPVGTNPEITAALNGENPKQANFIDPAAGMRLNANGEMIDPWGTPYFFHQLSGQEMEIHSAGPDRKMWTADDLVIK